MQRVEIKNLLILANFLSIILICIVIYILNERVKFLEEQERELHVNFIISGDKK